MQTLIVALLVLGCAIYAAWKLMPSVARRALASALLKLPLPAFFAAKMQKAATVASGCGCDGCDSAPVKSAAPQAPQVVTFHPRPKR
ncbi:MAG: hypothetical protein Q7T55_12035 [Solirubrobacteraceae bacterium]|nr:hypothetical protein [Solirubrobacteraceae bacterium]